MHSILKVVLISSVLLSFVESKVINVNYLHPGSSVDFTPEKTSLGFNKQNLNILCYTGKPKFLVHIFNTITLELICEGDDFTQYKGATPNEVKDDYENHKSMFSFNFLSNQKKVLYLDPFNESCIGIESNVDYKVKLNLIQADLWRVVLLCAGLILFFAAQKLTQNVLFYYTCGVLLGIFASFLIIVYLFSKLIPKKPMMYGVMVGGWTLGIYFIQMLLENMQTILVTYRDYVMWYVIITGFISFIICYRLGTPTNKKSKNLIQWSMQFIALLAIYFSSNYREATVGIDAAMLIVYYVPKNWIGQTTKLWKKKFPPKRKLLTMEEYQEQGELETTKALDDLKKYCNSPECKQWSTILKLKNPSRFASFIEGTSHLLEEEIYDYEASQVGELSDDEEFNLTESDDNVRVAEPERPRQSSIYNNRFTPRYATNGKIRNSTPNASRLNGSRITSANKNRTNNSLRRNGPNDFEMSDDDD